MGKLSKILLFSILALFLCASIAQAKTIEFGDTNNYWPGWGNGSTDDTKDTIGIPNFTGGEAVIGDDGYLKSLKFNYTSDKSWAPNYWWVVSPGDLFINIILSEQDTNWDYLVDLLADEPGPNNTDPAAGQYNLYSINEPLDGTDYVQSGKDNTGNWKGYYIRDDHPVALDVTGDPSSSIYFDGWRTLEAVNQQLSSTFDLTNQGSSSGIFLGTNDFIVGWAANCANDVIYEKVSNPIPEPATMLLFGTGLIGIAAIGRRKLSKR